MVVIIFLPVALFGLVASVNEYRDQGLGGVADCDGPLTAMLFVAPSLAVYAAGAVYYGLLLRGARRSLTAALLLALCVLMTLTAGAKAWAAYGEKNSPEHREACGEGW